MDKRSRCRKAKIEEAKKYGVYNGENQLYCLTTMEAFCTEYDSHTKMTNNVINNIVEHFERLEKLFGLNHKVTEDFKNGQVDISYVNHDKNSYILNIEDDPAFVIAAETLRGYGVIPFHGIKWDGQASPAFLCYMTLPDVLGYDDKHSIRVIPSSVSNTGIRITSGYRYIEVGMYFWIKDKLYEEYIETEGHNGALYPVIAYPDLPEEDNVQAVGSGLFI